MINPKLRDEMMFLLGQISAACYPLADNEQGHYDLMDSIRGQYVKILKELVGYEE